MDKEKELRRIVKGWFPDECFWIEAGIGSTVGNVDLLLALGGRLWPIELKRGAPIGWEWKPELRPAQWAVHRRMFEQGIKSVILVRSTITRGIGAVYSGEVLVAGPRGERVKLTEIRDRKSMEIFLGFT